MIPLSPRRRPALHRFLGTARRPLVIGAGALAGLFVATIAQGASYYWTGDFDNFWNAAGGASGTNWSSSSIFNDDPLSLPGSGDNVFFSVLNAGNLNTVLGQDFSINSLGFTSNAISAVTIGGANLLTLGSGGLTNNSPAAVTLTTNVAIGATQTWANNSTVPLSVSGVLSGASNLTLQGTGAISGPASGAFVFGGVNTYSGQISLLNAQTSLSINGAGSFASVTNATAGFTLLGGSSLILDNTGTNSASRLAGGVGITSSGGTITLLGNASAPTAQSAGTLTIGSGATYVTVTPGSGQSATLTLGSVGGNPSFSRLSGGTVTFSSTGTINAPNVALIDPTNPIIGGWATIGTTASVNGPLDWATVDGSGNVVPLAVYQLLVPAPLATDNSQLLAAGGTITLSAGSKTINSLSLGGTLLFTNTADVLTITSGGIISYGGTNTATYQGGQYRPVSNMADIGQTQANANSGPNPEYIGKITSGSGDLTIFTAGNLQLSSVITGAINLVKSGPGILDLSTGNDQTAKTANTFTGNTIINEGIIIVDQETQFGPAPGSLVPNAITLNGGQIEAFSSLNFSANRGITVGTRGGIISGVAGTGDTLNQPITGTGGITLWVDGFLATAGGTAGRIQLNNASGVNPNNYQGPTTFWVTPGWNSATTFNTTTVTATQGSIQFNQNNNVPATSAVTANLVDQNGSVLPNPYGPAGTLRYYFVDLQGKTESFGSLAGNLALISSSGSGSLTLGANGLSTNYSGVIGGTLGGSNLSINPGTETVTKVGSGTQTFSGANLYTGATAINGGTILVTGSLANTAVTVGNGTLPGALGGSGTIAGSVSVTSTGTLAPAVTPAGTSTLAISNNLTLNAGATLAYNFGAAGTPGASDTVNLTGAGSLLLKTGTDVLDINMLAGFGIGNYILIAVTGAGSFTDNATFSINGSTLYNYAVAPLGNNLVLTVTAGNPNLFWSGAVNGVWDINATANWTGAGNKYAEGSNLTFDDVDLASGGATAITVAAGGVNPNSITFNNASHNYTFNGAPINVVSGAGITKNQADNVTFNNAVTTQLLTVAGGSLTVGTVGSLAATVAAGVGPGATLNVNGALATPTLSVNGTLNIGSSASVDPATALIVNGAATFNNAAQTLVSLGDTGNATTGVLTLNGTALTLTGASSYDGAIVGSGSLTITGGTHILTNSGNTYSGGTTINGGTLQIGNGTVTGSLGAGTYSIASGATLALDYGVLAATPWASISGSGTLDLQSTAGLDWGTPSLTGAFTGALQIDNGHVAVDAAGGALGDAASVTVGSGASPDAGGQLDLSLDGNFGRPLTIAGSGYGVAGQESALRLAGAGLSTTVSGPVVLSASATIGATGSGIISGVISGGNNSTLTVGTSGENGTVVLSGANSYTGATTVAFGTLQFSTPAALYGANPANWTSSNITVASGATLEVNVGGPNDFTPAQVGTLLSNLSVVNNNGLLSGATFKFDTGNAAAPVVVTVALADSIGTGGGSLSLSKTGLGILNLSSGANNYTGATSVANGELILNGANTGTAAMNVTNTAKLDTSVLSLRNSNAPGAGTVNATLAPITLNATGTDLSTSILEIGATIGADPGGNNADFSYQVVAPGNAATGTDVATNVVAGKGQINLGFLGNSDDGTGFAGYNAAFTGANAVPPRIVALYTPSAGSTTLATLQEKTQFGQGTGDHLTLGSPTANTTLILLNPIDLNGGPQRRFASIRGVGITPEGEFAGAITDGGSSSVNMSFDGNGGLIFASAATTYTTVTLQINGGAIYVAASDPAAAGQTGALGEGTAAMQIGTSTAINPSGGTAVPTSAGANLGFMTYGANAGVGPAPTESTNRNIAVGGAGVTYASAVLGGVTDDYSAMNGSIALNEAPATPTTFTARDGGRVDFGGVISGIGSVLIGNSIVEGDAVTPGIALNNNGTIVFNGQNTYTGPTTISAGKLYVNGSTSALSTVSVGTGATLGGKGVVNGAVNVSVGGILEAGQAGAGTLILNGGLAFDGAAAINFLSLPAAGSPGLVITGTNTLTTTGGAISLNILSSIAGIGNYALINYNGVDTSTFTLSTPLPNRAIGTLAVNGGELDLDVTALASIVWTGSANANWETASANWSVQGGGSTKYIDNPGDSVIFDDTAGTHASVVINGTDVHPSAVTFNNHTVTYTVSGTNAIAGGAGLNINGASAVILTNSNTFTGPTMIAAGGTLQLGDGVSGHDGSIASTSSITDDGALIYHLASAQTYVGVIGGSGSLTVAGAGSLILTNANSYGGGTTITGGTLQLGNGTIGNDGTITGNVTNNGNLVFDDFGSPAIGAAIGGSGSLIKTGPGMLTLSGVSGYLGATTISAGGLTIGTTGSLTGTANISVSSGTVFTIAVGGSIPAATGLIDNGAAAFNNGAVSLGSLNGGNAAATLALNATSLTVTGGGAFAGKIQAAGSLAVAGGALTLSGANSYSGTTTVTTGTLIVSGALSGTSSTAVFSGGSLVVASAGSVASSVLSSGAVAGNGAIAGPLTVAAGVVAPGAAATGLGTLATGGLSLDSDSTLSIALGGAGVGQFGQVAASVINLASDGGVGAILTLSLVNNYVPAGGDFIVIGLNTGPENGFFQNTRPDSNPNYLGGASFPAIFVGTSEFAVSYGATATSFTGGNDVALLAVPEPGGFGLILAGVGVTLGLQRFRRRRCRGSGRC